MFNNENKSLTKATQDIAEINREASEIDKERKGYSEDKYEFDRRYTMICDSNISAEEKNKLLNELKKDYDEFKKSYVEKVEKNAEQNLAKKQKEIEYIKQVKQEFIRVTQKLRAAGFLTEGTSTEDAASSSEQSAMRANEMAENSEKEKAEWERDLEETSNMIKQNLLRR